jgi:phosphoribosylanthranilate isomerase
MVKLKICGMKRETDIKYAEKADMLGFIVGVPSSHRNLSLKEVAKLVKLVPDNIETVAVTTDASKENIKKIAEKTHADAIQIHTKITKKEVSDIRKILPRGVKITVLVSVHGSLDKIIKRAREMAESGADRIILDSKTPKKSGGTGKLHDWSISRKIRDVVYPFPVILAGGITPENIKEAVAAVRPWGIDVSSSVETNRKKSKKKIMALMKALGR